MHEHETHEHEHETAAGIVTDGNGARLEFWQPVIVAVLVLVLVNVRHRPSIR